MILRSCSTVGPLRPGYLDHVFRFPLFKRMRTCTRIVGAFLGYEVLLIIDIHWQDYLRLRPERLGFEARSRRNVHLIRDIGTSEWRETEAAILRGLEETFLRV